MTHHIETVRWYVTIFAWLMGLLVLTVVVAYLPLGALALAVALLIAFVKATLVVLYFMHVRWSTRLTWVVVCSGFFWLLILFGLTMTDYLSRGWVEGTPK